MSIEAVWTVRFGQIGAPEASLDGGVAIIESERVFGGDSGYAYVGDVAVSGQEVTGTLTITTHNPDWKSMYGRVEKQFALTFSGQLVDNDTVKCVLRREGYPDAQLVLRRFAALP